MARDGGDYQAITIVVSIAIATIAGTTWLSSEIRQLEKDRAEAETRLRLELTAEIRSIDTRFSARMHDLERLAVRPNTWPDPDHIPR